MPPCKMFPINFRPEQLSDEPTSGLDGTAYDVIKVVYTKGAAALYP